MILVPSITLVSPSRVRRRPKEATVKLRYYTRFLPELASGYSFFIYSGKEEKSLKRDSHKKTTSSQEEREIQIRREERLRTIPDSSNWLACFTGIKRTYSQSQVSI